MNGVGSWLVKTQAITAGVSSINVTNAFSADYDNYRVVIRGGSMASQTTVNFQLIGSATTYYNNIIYSNVGAPAVTVLTNNNATGAWTFFGIGAAQYLTLDAEIRSPFLSQFTVFRSQYVSTTDFGVTQGYHGATTSYTGFNLSASANFAGGTIEVFGIRN